MHCPSPKDEDQTLYEKIMCFLGQTMFTIIPPFIYYEGNYGSALNGDLYEKLEGKLKPGDILLRRYEGQFINFIYPTYYTHSAIYLGKKSKFGRNRIIHSTAPGVQMTDLFSFIRKSYIAVVRPKLSKEEVERGIENIASHCGKIFDYSMSFGKNKVRRDRLYCSELIYLGFRHALKKLKWKPKSQKILKFFNKTLFTPDDMLPGEGSNTEIIFKEKIL